LETLKMPFPTVLQAVIFDLDGLMVDSESLAEQAWRQVLAGYGRKLDDQTFREILGLRVADSACLICERFHLPISSEEAQAERDRLFLEAVPTRLRARPGLYPLLDELTVRGLPLGVATSGHRQYVTLALRTVELAGRFRAVATGDEVEQGKPAPDIYLLAAERLDVPPACCLALEDAPLGVESACAAGMTCVAVPNRWTVSLEFPGAYRVFPSLNEVRESLDDLLSVLSDGQCTSTPIQPTRYVAAGGVVVHDGCVLVLRRPSRGEARLPKGHVEPGESVQATALRETREESGYADLVVKADLGVQVVEFDYEYGNEGRHVVRTERYFLMALSGSPDSSAGGEEQFEPVWLTWDEALAALTFEPEREWVRRAREMVNER
jgi:HAD superfamily hydrolase (TIGR01509 family)